MLGDSFHFTKEGISKIQIPAAKQNVYKDTKEKGLILIVSYGGSKTYYFATTIQKEYHRIKIGRFPDISVADARNAVTELKNQIASGSGIRPLA